MSAPQYFDRGQVFYGGSPIAELQSGSISVDNGFMEIVTMGGSGGAGYAGGAKGPLMATITAKRAIPRAGINKAQDIHNAVVKQLFVQAMVVTGGKRYTVTGVPKGVNRAFGVTSASEEDFSLHGNVDVTDV